eukprot:CAMPEP_0179203352 /NCGR_PEP_ID=MMETSP0796-20121207/101367_1 /TAXON_ID=73915 /ORGANISM="Pyrodinium bahamense, Strain pbaha01" /LENGTH=71 /DNA_ID=CAMNT_0020908223 /DNA_START=426 /DNA_END=638 /DNA_ORIENTATION=-
MAAKLQPQRGQCYLPQPPQHPPVVALLDCRCKALLACRLVESATLAAIEDAGGPEPKQCDHSTGRDAEGQA